MKIKNETHYAIKAVCYLNDNSHNKLITANEIAQDQNIPKKFLYIILRKLKNNNIIKINTGCNGGYRISDDGKDITLLDIIEIIEGDLSISSCSKDENFCSKKESCSIFKEFQRVNEVLKSELNKKCIFSLLEEKV